MTSLLLAGAFFVGIHLFVAGTTLRDAIVSRIGEQAYLGLFSLASLGGMVWLVAAYRAAPTIALWAEPVALRPLVLVAMGLAFLLAGVGITTPSPTANVAVPTRLDAADAVQGVLRITRHPFLCGAVLFAALHLLVNGDAASVVLFGTILVLSAAGPASIDGKRRRHFGERYDRFAAQSSVLPFAAVLSGRQTLPIGPTLREIGLWRIALATALFLAALFGHTWLIGRSPFPVF